MSRIGKLPVQIPSGVNVAIDGGVINVEGSKGKLSQPLLSSVNVDIKDDSAQVSKVDESQIANSNYGLMRTLIQNMVVGVSQGFEKKLEINGVGFRASVSGDQLVLNVGYSHPVNYQIPQGIEITVDKNEITVKGASKQQVGQVAAEIRSKRKPEPYKGKGIQYQGEKIIRKSGKSGKE